MYVAQSVDVFRTLPPSPITPTSVDTRTSPAELRVDLKPTCTVNDAALAFVGAGGRGTLLPSIEVGRTGGVGPGGSDRGLCL